MGPYQRPLSKLLELLDTQAWGPFSGVCWRFLGKYISVLLGVEAAERCQKQAVYVSYVCCEPLLSQTVELCILG